MGIWEGGGWLSTCLTPWMRPRSSAVLLVPCPSEMDLLQMISEVVAVLRCATMPAPLGPGLGSADPSVATRRHAPILAILAFRTLIRWRARAAFSSRGLFALV